MASSSDAALTPEYINEQVQVQLRPLREEISSLKIQLDRNIALDKLEVANTTTRDIADVLDLCEKLKNRLDAIPSQTEEQIVRSLATTVQDVEHLQALFDASLGEPTLKGLTLAGVYIPGCIRK